MTAYQQGNADTEKTAQAGAQQDRSEIRRRQRQEDPARTGPLAQDIRGKAGGCGGCKKGDMPAGVYEKGRCRRKKDRGSGQPCRTNLHSSGSAAVAVRISGRPWPRGYAWRDQAGVTRSSYAVPLRTTVRDRVRAVTVVVRQLRALAQHAREAQQQVAHSSRFLPAVAESPATRDPKSLWYLPGYPVRHLPQRPQVSLAGYVGLDALCEQLLRGGPTRLLRCRPLGVSPPSLVPNRIKTHMEMVDRKWGSKPTKYRKNPVSAEKLHRFATVCP